MIVRRVATLAELRAAWSLVAEVLHQDETHPRNYAFYAQEFRRYPELLLVAHGPVSGPAAPGAPRVSDAAPDAHDSFGGRLVGALLAHAGAGYVHIGKLAVAPGQRGRGVGSALLREAERAAAEGARRPRLTLGADRRAVPFYLRHGYRPGILLQQTGGGGVDRLRDAVRRHVPGAAIAWSVAEHGAGALLLHVDAVDPALLAALKSAVPGGTMHRVFTKCL